MKVIFQERPIHKKIGGEVECALKQTLVEVVCATIQQISKRKFI